MLLDWVFAVSGTKCYAKQAGGPERKPTRHQAMISIGWQSGLVLKTSLKVVNYYEPESQYAHVPFLHLSKDCHESENSNFLCKP